MAARQHMADRDLVVPSPSSARPAARTTNEDVRQQNLSAVLQLVHGRGALSRSEIGARTGLTRSTVTALVQELLDLQVVCETSVKPTGRAGRPSLGVAAEDRVVALSVSADPHAVSVALVGLGGAVHSRVRHDLAKPPNPRRFAQLTSSLVDGMRADIDRHYRLVGAGVAVPGLVDSGGTVLLSPSLGWRRENLAHRLADAIGMQVTVGNDTSVGAMAETRFGVGRDVDNVLYLSGSMNGIGGGLVLDGALVRGTSGFAGSSGIRSSTRPERSAPAGAADASRSRCTRRRCSRCWAGGVSTRMSSTSSWASCATPSLSPRWQGRSMCSRSR